jgi:hypothetical protein
MNDNQTLYGINLDNYWYPKQLRAKKGYVGTKEDLETFARLLEAFCWANKQTCAVSTAIRGHFSGISPEAMLERYGENFEYVHPLEVVYQSEPMVFEHHFWQYKAANDAVYPMYADYVSVKRVIVADAGLVYTAIKGSAKGLHVCLQGTGWTELGGVMSGYPETVTYDRDEDTYEMRMFTMDARIWPEEIEALVEKWRRGEDLNLAYLCQDIIAEGKAMMASSKDRMVREG